MKTVFVTVGSTKFEQLIDAILQPNILKLFKSFSYSKIILQVGNGKHDNDELLNFKENQFNSQTGPEIRRAYREKMEIVAYRYKSSIKEDITEADLVISHAGAGSVMETLEANKKLIVVINETLMNNHQLELAEKMFDEGYLLYTTCSGLADKIELINDKEFSLNKYEPGHPRRFGVFLEKLFA
jgi:beta-1,4-N-acetylglucosaminyltransferase